jgi:hypothetical protein
MIAPRLRRQSRAARCSQARFSGSQGVTFGRALPPAGTWCASLM